MAGIDDELDMITEAPAEEEKTVSFEEKKAKRRPFFVWTVGGHDYNLRLTTKYIDRLEAKYNKPAMDLIIDNESVPRLEVMLTFIQCAMAQWNHGIRFDDVQNIVDTYLEEGGSITGLFKDVMVPTAMVSGFFPKEMADSLVASLKLAEEML